MIFIFRHIAWVDLAFNILSLIFYFTFSDRIGYKIQTFGLVYIFLILGLIGLTATSALLTFLSVQASIILGCLFFIPSVINIRFMLMAITPNIY